MESKRVAESRDRRREEVLSTLRHDELRNHERLALVVWVESARRAGGTLADDRVESWGLQLGRWEAVEGSEIEDQGWGHE